MRILLMLALLGACVDGGEISPDAPVELNLYVELGDRCAPTGEFGLVCGNGTPGACIDGVCHRQCYATQYPRCDAPLAEQHMDADGADVCFCD